MRQSLSVAYTRKVAALQRRLDWLEDMIPQRQSDRTRQEAGALKWAIAVRCANTVTAPEYTACACPKDGLVYHSDAEEECVYCTLHLTSQHDCTGCLVEGCPCGYDGDWHPDPPRGDE